MGGAGCCDDKVFWEPQSHGCTGADGEPKTAVVAPLGDASAPSAHALAFGVRSANASPGMSGFWRTALAADI